MIWLVVLWCNSSNMTWMHNPYSLMSNQPFLERIFFDNRLNVYEFLCWNIQVLTITYCCLVMQIPCQVIACAIKDKGISLLGFSLMHLVVSISFFMSSCPLINSTIHIQSSYFLYQRARRAAEMAGIYERAPCHYLLYGSYHYILHNPFLLLRLIKS